MEINVTEVMFLVVLQFLSTAGFGNEMKLKSRLPPFSLIHIQCQRAFCFLFCSLLSLSKFRYTPIDYAYWVVLNSMSGIVSSVD